jgi:NAD(P)-dependent dehydrogenase (short-subunit alcohol dehydrogenase family)
MSDRALEARVVVLTGASSGIGSQLAVALANGGARTVIAARRRDRIESIARELPDCVPVECDVTVDDDRRRVIATALERFGRIDGLVNNAGTSFVAPALKESVEDFTRIIELNLVAPFALAQRAARSMVESERGGVIVNIASIWGLVGVGQIPESSYAASKGGILSFTSTLAAELAPRGVRVNALSPGPVETPIYGKLGMSDEALRKELEAEVAAAQKEAEKQGTLLDGQIAKPETIFEDVYKDMPWYLERQRDELKGG